MIESVQARQRGAYQFEEHYDNLCALQDSAPVAAVKAHLPQGVIDLNGDRIRLKDWMPIINSIRINKSLQFIAVRSAYQLPPAEDDDKRAAILRRKLPSIRSKEMTHRLVKGLKECLFVSPSLSCIELQGLALRERDLQLLVKGISKSSTLRHLSLEHCRIGDQGLEVLCQGLKTSKHINSVNLSGCCLSPRGGTLLAALIKHQGMQRHNEAWRDSLRYRRPDLDRMSGLRRITCNKNPLLGDEGSASLAEALKDDLWLKALDLQACGIGQQGAQRFLEVLKYNTTLVILDLRANPLIGRDVMHALMEQLMLNSNGDQGEYKWLSGDKEQQPSPQVAKTRRRATKVLNASLAKKTTIKVTPVTSRRRAARSTVNSGPSPGLPWRTAARAHRFRGHPPDISRFIRDPGSEEQVTTSTLITNPNEEEEAGVERGVTMATREAEEAMRALEESHMSMDLTNQKEVLVELEQMRRHLREERLARAKADQRLLHLMLENRRLTEEVDQLRRGSTSGPSRLEDENFLESIETAFKQFHGFIDMLREAGLGQLVSMAGLDQSQWPFPPPSHNTTYANLPLASSAFVNDLDTRQRPAGGVAAVSMTTSYTEEAPVLIGSRTGVEGSAKAEADQVYSRLVQETTGGTATSAITAALEQEAAAVREEPNYENHQVPGKLYQDSQPAGEDDDDEEEEEEEEDNF